MHTDILFPMTSETRARFGFAEAAGVPVNHPDAQLLILGWGSAAFYTTAGTYADIAAGIPFGLWTPANWSVTLSLDWHLPGQTG